MPIVSINYDLGQHGWSSFRLTVADNSIDIGPFGYCTDALGDLVRAALLLATSAYRAEVRFDGEPFEWRLVLDEGWASQLHPPDLRLRVLTFDSLMPEKPETEGETVFQAKVAADDFVRAVLQAAQKIWDEHGAAGYNERWISSTRFPLRGLTALKAALACNDPPSWDDERSAVSPTNA